MSMSEKIKPSLTEDQAAKLVTRLYGLKVSAVRPLPSYDDQNFHILASGTQGSGNHPNGFVLKVLNSSDSQQPDLVETQTRIMMFLNGKGFPSPKILPTIGGKNMSLETIECDGESKQYMIRLLTYLPGIPLAKIPLTQQNLYTMGRIVAQMDKLLQEEFQYDNLKSLHREDFIWNLSNTHHLENWLVILKRSRNRLIIEQVIQQFKAQILPNLSMFRKCIIHGDCNAQNILVESSYSSGEDVLYNFNLTHLQNELSVSGILDFGDMSYGCYVFELAILITYMMVENNDPISVGGHVLAGFESVIPLTPEERNALFLLVLCRFSQSLVIASKSVLLYPENEEYLMSTAKNGWKCLQQLWELGKEAVEMIWFEIVDSYQKLSRILPHEKHEPI